jgi:hypothetical protein
MLFWTKSGEVSSRELYRFDPDPREENRDITETYPDKADQLQEMLLNYLKSVNAETPA